MKKILGMLAALIISATASYAQQPKNKIEIRNVNGKVETITTLDIGDFSNLSSKEIRKMVKSFVQHSIAVNGTDSCTVRFKGFVITKNGKMSFSVEVSGERDELIKPGNNYAKTFIRQFKRDIVKT